MRVSKPHQMLDVVVADDPGELDLESEDAAPLTFDDEIDLAFTAPNSVPSRGTAGPVDPRGPVSPCRRPAAGGPARDR
jgi:hypothetical protein